MLKWGSLGTTSGANSSGWSAEELYFKFIEHCIRQTKPTKDDHVLLIIDNHESHHSMQGLDLESKSGVVIVIFYPALRISSNHLIFPSISPSRHTTTKELMLGSSRDPGKIVDIYSVTEIVGQGYPRDLPQVT